MELRNFILIKIWQVANEPWAEQWCFVNKREDDKISLVFQEYVQNTICIKVIVFYEK